MGLQPLRAHGGGGRAAGARGDGLPGTRGADHGALQAARHHQARAQGARGRGAHRQRGELYGARRRCGRARGPRHAREAQVRASVLGGLSGQAAVSRYCGDGGVAAEGARQAVPLRTPPPGDQPVGDDHGGRRPLPASLLQRLPPAREGESVRVRDVLDHEADAVVLPGRWNQSDPGGGDGVRGHAADAFLRRAKCRRQAQELRRRPQQGHRAAA
mmetsp:Transcript_9786/g.23260  ORF Transcript_9786/g.23260 Transcript_9786/m.23260 type:complete len:215 (-) Transcript_9786:750-1394(-)